MSQSLYRKYRSRGFDEIVGQSHVTDLLKNAVKAGTFAHAYLLTGPRGTGKTSIARILAHEINQLTYTEDGTHLDIIEIDAASNRRIDDIRDLREKVHIAPTSAKYKIYIIDEVHMLTGESFNALLKTIEEPPEHAIFILATTEVHKVPATIISRTQRFHFKPGTVKDISDHLATIAKKEKIDIDEDALALIARHSDGGFRDSVSLLDQVSSLKRTSAISREDVEMLLGIAPMESIERIVHATIDKNQSTAVSEVTSLLEIGIHPASITQQLLSSIQDKAQQSPALYELMEQLLDVTKSHAPHMKLIAIIANSSAGERPVKAHKTTPTVATKSHISVQSPVIPKIVSAPKKSHSEKVPEIPVKKAEAVDIHVSIDGFDWSRVLLSLKQEAPALHSVVKQMTTSIHGDTLTLRSSFALHRKKVESDKYMKQLVDCIKTLYNASPRVVIADLEKRELDMVESKVADIMGGGEAV